MLMRKRAVHGTRRQRSRLESDVDPAAEHSYNDTPIQTVFTKWASFRTRFLWTMVLLLAFFLILAAGHFYCSVLVMILMMVSFHEIISLKRDKEREKNLPMFRAQRYYWPILTIFGSLYSYILPLARVFADEPPEGLYWITANHTFCTYIGALLGFTFFIISLRRNSIKYQFGQFSLVLLTCLIVIGQGTAQIKNISSGLIWFIVPSTLVVANDISAYLCGVAWGRTKLIPRISPKKTVEGFFGASVVTFVVGFILIDLLSRSQVLVCPEARLALRPFAMWSETSCEVRPDFIMHRADAPIWLQKIGYTGSVYWKPVWIHGLILAGFASFVAPLGGFLASAFKRALKVKDFSDYIPGHGGITDRFDCQLLMGMFTFVYLRSFVTRERSFLSVSSIVRLSDSELTGFFHQLANDLRASLPAERYNLIQESFCALE